MKRKYYATVDVGTTNTRAALFDENFNEAAKASCAVGVKDTAITGSNAALKEGLRQCLAQALERGNTDWDGVACVIASGMITSDVGILEVPHLTAPAGIRDFAENMVSAEFKDIAPLPIWFIPGLKNREGGASLDNYSDMDIMRGEETETIGLLPMLPRTECVLILPGSHTKFVRVRSNGDIAGCLTSMTGELLSLLTNQSIISEAVSKSYADIGNYDKDMVLEGYSAAAGSGLGRAAFLARILSRFSDYGHRRIACYLLGAVLQSDIAALSGSAVLGCARDTLVAIAGKEPLKTALYDILKNKTDFKNIISLDCGDMSLSSMGCLAVAKQRGLITGG